VQERGTTPRPGSKEKGWAFTRQRVPAGITDCPKAASMAGSATVASIAFPWGRVKRNAMIKDARSKPLLGDEGVRQDEIGGYSTYR
jgi:hypothetical protein